MPELKIIDFMMPVYSSNPKIVLLVNADADVIGQFDPDEYDVEEIKKVYENQLGIETEITEMEIDGQTRRVICEIW